MALATVEITRKPLELDLEALAVLPELDLETPVNLDDLDDLDALGLEIVVNLDDLAGNEVMRGCGNDNPY
ncbi:hypothetical protein ACFW6S_06935 [Streptomyces sp. NPDC058740]|uniref:hypothetical protein n=1 Tax=Streptomyces sp. NPDC058740 TaxID=3346619 RepID=UPI003687E590